MAIFGLTSFTQRANSKNKVPLSVLKSHLFSGIAERLARKSPLDDVRLHPLKADVIDVLRDHVPIGTIVFEGQRCVLVIFNDGNILQPGVREAQGGSTRPREQFDDRMLRRLRF